MSPTGMSDRNPRLSAARELGLLRRELAMLAERYRRATVMYYVDGMSCARIAAEMNVSTETVKYLLFRARKLIRGGHEHGKALRRKKLSPRCV